MKTKKIMLSLSMLTIVALMITPTFANGVEYFSDLVAGQDEANPVGAVTIYFNNAHTEMYIKLDTSVLPYGYPPYTTQGDCELVETHIWVGDDLDEVPRTKKGNPKIGHFDYAETLPDGTQTFTQTVDVSGLDDEIFILIHAVVDCPCKGQETAWGEGPESTMFSENQDIFGNRWGYYISIDKSVGAN